MMVESKVKRYWLDKVDAIRELINRHLKEKYKVLDRIWWVADSMDSTLFGHWIVRKYGRISGDYSRQDIEKFAEDFRQFVRDAIECKCSDSVELKLEFAPDKIRRVTGTGNWEIVLKFRCWYEEEQ